MRATGMGRTPRSRTRSRRRVDLRLHITGLRTVRLRRSMVHHEDNRRRRGKPPMAALARSASDVVGVVDGPGALKDQSRSWAHGDTSSPSAGERNLATRAHVGERGRAVDGCGSPDGRSNEGPRDHVRQLEQTGSHDCLPPVPRPRPPLLKRPFHRLHRTPTPPGDKQAIQEGLRQHAQAKPAPRGDVRAKRGPSGGGTGPDWKQRLSVHKREAPKAKTFAPRGGRQLANHRIG